MKHRWRMDTDGWSVTALDEFDQVVITTTVADEVDARRRARRILANEQDVDVVLIEKAVTELVDVMKKRQS